MILEFQALLNKINPKQLLLIDGIGAFFTAFMLGIILPRFEDIIGMPKDILFMLSFLAAGFTIYSICCYFLIKINWNPFIKIIAIANLLYCILTFGLIIYLFQKLTIFGILYFVIEITIILILVFLERKIVLKLEKTNSK